MHASKSDLSTINRQHPADDPQPPTAAWPLAAGYAVLAAFSIALEMPAWLDAGRRAERLSGWMCGIDADILPFLPWLLLWPILWFAFPVSGRTRKRERRMAAWLARSPQSNPQPDRGAVAASLLLGALAFSMSSRAGMSMAGFPPAYHDEYSYLFQAQTFLEGRVWFPSFTPHPELFDQMHVLNEGRFASRYFPGVGLWIAPFLAMGDPWLGHQAAFGIVALATFWVGRELSNNGVGFGAGLLTALSPGMILFSTVLLSHLPTLACLMLFLWTYLTGMRRRSAPALLLSGIALAWAMLCRPMTAAGFALPCGVHFAWWWLQGDKSSARSHADSQITTPPITQTAFARRTIAAASLGSPLIAGFLILAAYNHALTGSPLRTPYQLYTDIYTPRHVYGFNNVLRGEQRLGPKVLDHYDRWAENLTVPRAIRNLARRVVASFRGTLGYFPIAASVVALCCLLKRGTPRWWLVAASIASLHAVHIPYWFEGIMGWHYVFESAPLWLLLVVEGTHRLSRALVQLGRGAVRWGWYGMLATAVAVNLLTLAPLWPGRLARGLVEIRYPRAKYAAFATLVDEAAAGRRAIVFIIPDPSDRHMDYVTNHPSLATPVLRARLLPGHSVDDYAPLFPDRDVWIYDARRATLELLRRGTQAGQSP